MGKLKICVIAPDFRHSSGGIFVLHYLAKLLNDLGHEVTMSTCVQNPAWPSYALASRDIEADLFITPEIFNGYLKNVCRWVLNTPGKLAGPRSYRDHERVWYFSEELRECAENATNHPVRKLFLPSVDRADLPGEMIKSETAYFIGKYKGDVSAAPENAVSITALFPTTRKETYNLLARCDEFYCFDNFSFIATEAAYFGAQVYMWDGEKWQDYVPQWDFNDYIMDHARDLMTVSQFVNEACETFNL